MLEALAKVEPRLHGRRRGGEGRFSALAATFTAATRLEADFWQMGLDAAGN